MKLNIENIIYILVIIIWVVVGFIKKNKKKNSGTAPPDPNSSDPKPPDFSEILEEILGKKRPATTGKPQNPVVLQNVQPKTKIKEIKSPPPKYYSGTDFTQRSLYKTGKQKTSFLQKKEPRTTLTEEPAPEELKPGGSDAESNYIPFQGFQGPFDVRQAIIFSEIMNPPYR